MSCIYSHEDGAYCDKHSHGAVTLSCHGEEDCPDRIVQTNSDKIRAMSDEELARWIADDLIEPGYYSGDECYQLWLDWLKSPVEE